MRDYEALVWTAEHYITYVLSLQWRYNGRDGVSTHRRLDCFLNHLFRRRSKKTSELRATGLCEGNSPVTGEFPAQRVSNAKMFPFDDVTIFCSDENSRVGEVGRSANHCFLRYQWIVLLTEITLNRFSVIKKPLVSFFYTTVNLMTVLQW